MSIIFLLVLYVTVFCFKGIYGKLDVLYAGIIAENACTENKNRFLVFFDDGFAQYLPVKKLHHVYHTGLQSCHS